MRDEAAESMTALADLQLSQGDFVKSQTLVDQAMALLESVRTDVPGGLRASYYARKRKLLDLSVQIAMRSASPDAAVQGLLAAERGRARSLLDLLAERSADADPARREWIEQRANLRRRIDLLSMQLSAPAISNEPELRNRVESLIAQNTEVEARINDSINDPAVGRPLESLDELQRHFLRPDTAILEYHLGESRSYLWLVETGQVHSFPLGPGVGIANIVAQAVDLFVQVTQRQESTVKQLAYQRAMNELSRVLTGPLAGISLPKRLILVPDGALNFLPFAALRIPGRKEYLGIEHDLLQSPSATYLTVGAAPRPPQEFPFYVLAVTDPVFSVYDSRVSAEARKRFGRLAAPDLVRLPFDTDIKTIAQLVPASRRRVFSGFDANPEKLRATHLADFGILYFSTHATIDDQIPDLSRIALSMLDRDGRPIDGFLHPHDLWDFHLQGSTIVLSACDTARGKLLIGEGLMGVSSSLFHARAAQLVLSLTELDGLASAQFFSETYKHVFARRPVPMERALTLARRAFAASNARRDPYYWASIVLVGRPSEDK